MCTHVPAATDTLRESNPTSARVVDDGGMVMRREQTLATLGRSPLPSLPVAVKVTVETHQCTPITF